VHLLQVETGSQCACKPAGEDAWYQIDRQRIQYEHEARYFRAGSGRSVYEVPIPGDVELISQGTGSGKRAPLASSQLARTSSSIYVGSSHQ
jgi:hypothetical protein